MQLGLIFIKFISTFDIFGHQVNKIKSNVLQNDTDKS
jgi:hypothetical protein